MNVFKKRVGLRTSGKNIILSASKNELTLQFGGELEQALY